MVQSSREAGDAEIMLGLLTSIERDGVVTQRKLAGELGIALGLANAYIGRCVRKGLVKIQQVPLRRYGYYLTPQGFAEKSRLTAEYFTVSLDFFRRARNDCAALFRHCASCGWQRVALYGAGDLADIAVLSAGESTVAVVCVIDPEHAGKRCAGLAIVADIAAARRLAGEAGLDGLVVTDTRAPQACFDALVANVAAHGLATAQIVAPSLLNLSPLPAELRVAVAEGRLRRDSRTNAAAATAFGIAAPGDSASPGARQHERKSG